MNNNVAGYIQLYDPALKERLSHYALSPGQAAKRDLYRYHALLLDAMPAIHEHVAGYLVAHVRDHGHPINAASTAVWRTLVDHLIADWRGASRHSNLIDLYRLDPLERYAVLDAADKAVREHDANPERNPSDVLRAHFRLYEED